MITSTYPDDSDLSKAELLGAPRRLGGSSPSDLTAWLITLLLFAARYAPNHQTPCVLKSEGQGAGIFRHVL